MPPKKDATKTEKIANNTAESAPKKEKPKKNNATNASVEFSPRALRPRKTPSSTEPVKANKAPKAAIKKQGNEGSRKTKLEKNSAEEPAVKVSKIEEENGEDQDHGQANYEAQVIPLKAKKAPKQATTKQGNEKGRRTKLEKKKTAAILGKTEEENEEDQDDKQEHGSSSSSIYEFSAKTIQGEEISLSKYKGHVCVIVNVASKCGHTGSNYKEFVELFHKYGESKGLRILAFPCNQFGKQEPADNEAICEFAKKKNVKFDMFEKIDVNGKNAHPLWKFLTSQKQGPKGEKIEWNFTKFLINKDGQVVDRFKSGIKPLALVSELDKLW